MVMSFNQMSEAEQRQYINRKLSRLNPRDTKWGYEEHDKDDVLRITHHERLKAVGTAEEVMEAAAAARKEIERLAAQKQPKPTRMQSLKFGLAVCSA